MTDRYETFYAEMQPHVDTLYAMAIRMTRDRAEAEDLVQETMLKAFRYIDRYEVGTNARAWLSRILTNTFYNRHRARKARPELLLTDDTYQLEERTAATDPHPLSLYVDEENELYRKVFTDEVRYAIEQLPEHYRVVVLLADLQELAYKEISEILEIPIGTVMSRLHRGRKELRNRLKGYAREEGYLPFEDVLAS